MSEGMVEKIEDAASWMADRGFAVLSTDAGPFVKLADGQTIGGEELVAHVEKLKANAALSESMKGE